ncbi:MAG: aminoacyl-histidine dipeptidase [Bacteroidota bacterium]|nr:aminoacyl-histidine dipeptidase [Bacteroidota bacterium]
MNNDINKLVPKAIWKNFSDLNAVPRPSKKEEKVINFMLDFGKKLGLPTIKDKVGNVIITKPATVGMENRKTIILQSHLDMVCQKNNDTDFDFDTQGIQMYIDGDWVKAKGTTLGADNGIGVATIMGILESKDIPHPAIEALFTIDEETGMTGAIGLEGGLLKGEILLNLDTEEDNEIDIGCAGGIDVTAHRVFSTTPFNGKAIKLEVKGLQGGHSGMDIHKGFGNANKILTRFMYLGLNNHIQLIDINSGGLRNAIPREGIAIFNVADTDTFVKLASELKTQILDEFASIEKNLLINIETVTVTSVSNAISTNDSAQIIKALHAAHNGVFRMSPDVSDLVEASNNLARVELKDGHFKALNLTRSSVESTKLQVATQLKSCFELAGIQVDFSGSYPGWKPNMNSEILKVLVAIYEKQNQSKPEVVACHAGLECGILGTNYPNMDMISYGPTIKGAHSPEERVSISSVEKFWKYTLEILENIPTK